MDRAQHDIEAVEGIFGERAVLTGTEPIQLAAHQYLYIWKFLTLRQDAPNVLVQPVGVHGNVIARVHRRREGIVLRHRDVGYAHLVGMGDKLFHRRMPVVRHIGVVVLGYPFYLHFRSLKGKGRTRRPL